MSDDVRQMAYRFHPSILDDLGLMKVVRRLVDDFSASTGISGVCLPGLFESRANRSGHVRYRIAQESLNNVARHAKATEVEVELIVTRG